MIDRAQIWRLALVILLMTGVFSGLGARLVYLHTRPPERWRERIEKNRAVEQQILVGRGRVLDRGGALLAMDRPVSDVCVDPSVIVRDGYVQFIAKYLAAYLGQEPEAVYRKLSRPERRFEYIQRLVPDDVVSKIAALKLPSTHVWFEPASARFYPLGELMCHAVGFSNADGIGSAGVEQFHNRYLKGRPGLRLSERDGRRRELPGRRKLEIPPQAGADVTLALDVHIQRMLEEALDHAVASNHAAAAWGAVQLVRTGEILALANRPGYDLNDFRHSDTNERMNRLIGYTYEPGSTFKIAVYAAAFNEGLITPDTVIDCEGGTWFFRGRPLHDFHPYGRLTAADALKKSSNIAAAKVGLMLGEERLERYLRDFGFGAPTGIDLPGEEGGIFYPRRRWDSLTISRIPMGHAISATSMQILNTMCTLANGGYRLRPAVVRQVKDTRGGEIVSFAPQVVSRPVSEKTARLMIDLLARVTEPGGTGRRAVVPGYTVAGKTGTAEKILPDKTYSKDKNIASFVGVIPAEDPVLGIMIVVDEPQGGKGDRTGGVAAAPFFREVAEQAVRYLVIPPSGRVEVIDPGINDPEDLAPEEAYHDVGAAL